ncbi:hypothetical protein LC2W_2556 [Lacticaseibacillus paracasei]|nr:hypothetical protein LC2W_2556 [Lacticaseibacillus paracasei]AEA58071.1 Hypothetical cytosolic protein [Lacticaseibacillus paracasei]CAQ67632.1 Putative uncharacterized protein [Lacticaseibacillus paracasei]
MAKAFKICLIIGGILLSDLYSDISNRLD